MKFAPVGLIAALGGLLLTTTAQAQPAAVTKTNPLPVYMHYMPWFETPQTLGGTSWGDHWKMKNKDPKIVDANGRRQIASHYYPLIGPYASRDPDVIEYHMLLMKYSGVDGVLIDWYGQQGANGDIGNLLTSSNAIVGKTDDFGMKFGVVMEDRFSTKPGPIPPNKPVPDIDKAVANMAYLKNNYFNNPQYIRQNAGADPLVGVFGPITFAPPIRNPQNTGDSVAQWTQILAAAGEDVDFLTLWYQKNDAGSNADGEYSWIYQDASRTHLQHQSDYYNFRAPTLGTAGGVAYPGFNDYYVEGGVGPIVNFEIPHNNGQTLASTLALAAQKSSVIDFLQLATFNDFGEGTMFEPTVETGFEYLKQVQQFTGVPYTEYELQFIFRLYRARKEFAGQADVQAQLDIVAADLAALDFHAAHTRLDSIRLPGDFDKDGDADGADFLTWQQQLGQTGLYPLATRAADANADGVVDGKDYAIWLEHTPLIPHPPPGTTGVPEPATAALLLAGLAAFVGCVKRTK